MKTVQDAMNEAQRVTTDWVKWAWRLEKFVEAHPVECHCWDLDRSPRRHGTQGHTDDCEEWQQLASAIRTKSPMFAGPYPEDQEPIEKRSNKPAADSRTDAAPAEGA